MRHPLIPHQLCPIYFNCFTNTYNFTYFVIADFNRSGRNHLKVKVKTIQSEDGIKENKKDLFHVPPYLKWKCVTEDVPLTNGFNVCCRTTHTCPSLVDWFFLDLTSNNCAIKLFWFTIVNVYFIDLKILTDIKKMRTRLHIL